MKEKSVDLFLSDLEEDVIPWCSFKAKCFKGIPDEMGLRPLAWRLLLGYLPPAKSEWSEILLEKRTSYVHFVNDFVVSPGLNAEEATHSSLLIDHPLNLNPRSQWQAYFKDNEVLLQIDKDVRRLYPAISFFQRATEFPNVNVVNGSISKLHYRVQSSGLTSSSLHNKGMGVQKLETRAPSTIMDYAVLPEGSEAHWEVVERILFIYAKLNPGQGYVQGMNEIIGPIYYAFATDPNLQWREHAEADSFFLFYSTNVRDSRFLHKNFGWQLERYWSNDGAVNETVVSF